MNLKDQIDIQKLYNKQVNASKNDIEKRDDIIKDLQRKLKSVNKKDIIIG